MPLGIVDQHFDQRRRLGRLVRAISYLPLVDRLGFGIDENTGFLVDLAARQLTVVGEGALTILDGRTAIFGEKGTALTVQNLLLHVFSDGDTFDLYDGKIQTAAYKKRTVGHENYLKEQPAGDGMMVAYRGIAKYLGAALLDNSATRKIAAVSFNGTGAGVRYTFSQWPESNGYWGIDDKGRAHYSLTGVRLAVEPVTVKINEQK